MSFTLGFSLQQLWGMINALQLILYVPLFNISFPVLVAQTIYAFQNIIQFDVLDVSPDLEKVFQLPPSSIYPSYNTNFANLGYNSNFIYNINLPIAIFFG